MRREKVRDPKRELRLTMSVAHFYRCVKSEAFMNLAVDFDAIVRLPMDSAGSKIEVTCPTGFRQNVSYARKVIEEALERPECSGSSIAEVPTSFFIVAELVVPWKKHHLVIGKGGAYINQVRWDHQVSVSVPPYKKRSNVVYVSGYNLERVEAAVKTLMEQVALREEEWMVTIADEVQVEVAVPQVYRGRIIGKQGATIERLRSEFRVRITLPKLEECNSAANTVVIKGPEASCLAAKKAILSMTGLSENFLEVQMPYVAKEYRSQRSVLNMITSAVHIVRNEHNVRIYYTFCDGLASKSAVVINAADDCVPGACYLAAAQLEKLWPVVRQVEATADQLSRIIGRNGETIRQLRQKYSVLIHAPMKKDVLFGAATCVILIGRRDNIVVAEAAVTAVLNTPLQETEVLFVN